MYLFGKSEREAMAEKLKKSWEEVKKNDEEAKQLRGRLAFIEMERKALENEEILVKRAYRLNGWKGCYRLVEDDTELLDCDF